MKKLIILIFFIFCGCFRQNIIREPFDPEKIMLKAYSDILLEDGIDKKEASILADAYFGAYISGCGVTSPDPIDKGNVWEVKTMFGAVAVPYDSVFVDKKTGKLTCDKGPVVEAPSMDNK